MFSTQAKFPIRSSFGALFPKYHNWKLPSFLLSSSSTLWQKLQLRTSSANLSFQSKYIKDLLMGRKPFLFQFGVLNAMIHCLHLLQPTEPSSFLDLRCVGLGSNYISDQ